MIITTLQDLPPRVHGLTVRSFDGEDIYTIIINAALSLDMQKAAYLHELSHIQGNDFECPEQAQVIEWVAHNDTAKRKK